MKKITLTSLLAMILFAFAMKANAQTQTNYFIGKWKLLLKELPQGDGHLNLTIADSAGQLKGVMVDSADSKKIIQINKIEQKSNEITMYFNAQGSDVSIVLTKKDPDHATGSLMGMFDAAATRNKEK